MPFHSQTDPWNILFCLFLKSAALKPNVVFCSLFFLSFNIHWNSIHFRTYKASWFFLKAPYSVHSVGIAQLFHCLICGHLDYLGSTQRYDEFPRPYCALGGGRWMPRSRLTFSPRPDPEKYRLTLLFSLKTSSAFRPFPQKVSVSRTNKIKVDLLVKLGGVKLFS